MKGEESTSRSLSAVYCLWKVSFLGSYIEISVGSRNETVMTLANA